MSGGKKLFVANLATAVSGFSAIYAIVLGAIIGFVGCIWKIWRNP